MHRLNGLRGFLGKLVIFGKNDFVQYKDKDEQENKTPFYQKIIYILILLYIFEKIVFYFSSKFSYKLFSL